ncbi:MAG: hypothetical protein ROZ64_07060 [Burkholderiaceae bacterium]|jgi:hypothetical protein|nr:hypothetical protein [Burkholderiaceae bacterium]
MKELDYEERLARADRAVSTADYDVRTAVQMLSSGATPRLAQIGAAAVAIGVVGALLLRRGRRSNSRLSKAIDYTVLLPLAANVIPRIVAMMSGTQQHPYRAPVEPRYAPRDRARTP